MSVQPQFPGQYPHPYSPPQVALRPSALPEQPTDYPRFMRSPRWSWWRPVVLLVVAAVAFVLASTVAVVAAYAIDVSTGRVSFEELQQQLSSTKIKLTPAVFLANNLALALLIPISMLLAWAFTGQRPGWLSSVVGRLRWKWLLTCAVALAPIWIVAVGVELMGHWRELKVGPDTVLLIVGILLTQPLQAAGEEYFFRGLAARSLGSFFTREKVALAVAAVVPAIGFMFAHGAGDPWLNLFYLTFGLAAAWMTWRTGGLEAAIAMHVVNNLASGVTMPFSDISDVMNREAGVVQAADVIPTLATLVLGVVVVELLVRKFHPVRLGPAQPPAAKVVSST